MYNFILNLSCSSVQKKKLTTFFACMLSLYQDPSDQCYRESMMLEAVDPVCPQNIHVATVTKVKGQHIWIRLEGDSAIYATFCFESF